MWVNECNRLFSSVIRETDVVRVNWGTQTEKLVEALPSSVLVEAQPKPKRRKILLKWSLFATALLFSYLIWTFGSGLMAGAGPSDDAVRRFHSQLDLRDYEELLLESDEGFQNSESHEELLKFFASVHSKLGVSQGSTRTNINVNVSTNGTLITVTYQSTFEQGNATETFTWRRTAGGDLRLFGYNVQSNVFLSK